jgi:hypothetical protein
VDRWQTGTIIRSVDRWQTGTIIQSMDRWRIGAISIVISDVISIEY